MEEQPLRALVVYESMFGNTERVAGAVARGLQHEGVDTGLVEVRSAGRDVDPDIDLLVLGGPTHGFSMSRPGTRADAVQRGAPEERAGVGLREWLEALRLAAGHRPAVATFDTRASKVRWLPQAAGPSAARAARRLGLEPIAKPVGFLVDDVQGPLVHGETDRAVAWGRSIARALVDHVEGARV